MKEQIQRKIVTSLALQYQAEINYAEATLLIYLNNPVGIGEHPQHINEIDTLIEKLTNAKDKLKSLNKLTEDYLHKSNSDDITPF